MKTSSIVRVRLGALLVTTLAVAPSSYANRLLDLLYPDYDLVTVTVTDFTPEGSLRRTPTPNDPVYYQAVSGGYKDLGGLKAGEKPIARSTVNQTMLKALAKEGYLPATGTQEPSIVLIWSWGTFNREIARGFDPTFNMTIQANRQSMERFLGIQKVDLRAGHGKHFQEYTIMPELFSRGVAAEDLSNAASDDLFFATVSAYDARPNENNKPVLLWQTRISSPSRGFWLPEALPAMLAIAHPYIGKETSKPVWIRASEKFRPDIKLGDTKMVEYIENAAPKVVELDPSG
jgi:hypothetical protein